jgi:hypothetical protein
MSFYKFLLVSIEFLLVSTSFYLISTPAAQAGLILNRPLYIGLTSGLVGFWSFDGQDMAGNTAYDRSGNGNNGTLTNGPVRRIGRIGQALDFDGSNDFVTVPDSSSLDSTSNITISVWAKADNWIGQGFENTSTLVKKDGNYILRKDNSATTGDGTHRLKMYWWDGTNLDVHQVPLPSAGEWHHIVGINENNTTRRIYIDGVLQSGTDDLDNSGTRNLTVNLSIGNHQSAANESFDGLIDEVRIYNRVLSADEIKRLYNIGATLKINKPSYTGLDSGLVGFWSFDGKDMAGNTAYDRSGNGNNGTLTNSPVRDTGRIGQALRFNGSDSYVDAGDIGAIDNATELSICAWAFHSTISDDDVIFSKYIGASDDGPLLLRDDVGGLSGRTDTYTIRVAESQTADAAQLESATNASKLNAWTHVCGTAVLNNATGLRLYINAVEDPNSPTSTVGVDNMSSGTRQVTIGSLLGASTLSGLIDEVRIYNRVLSADEIKRLYNIGATLKVNKPSYTGLDSGLVGFWSFDGQDISGTTAFDRSGLGNNGTISGAARTAGRIGQALEFDGVDDYVDALSPDPLDDLRTFTVSAWIKPDSMGEGDFGRITDKRNLGTVGWDFFTCSSGAAPTCTDAIRLRQAFGTSGGVWDSPSNSVARNVWQHVVVTYNSNSTANDPSFYINGASVAVTEGTAPSGSYSSDGAVNFTIGNTPDTTRTFDGAIDEVRIYNRVLTSDEIKRLYNMGR